MKLQTKSWIFILLLLVLVFGFYAGKYKEWENDPTKLTSKGSFFKDWQVAGILALIVIFGVMGQLPKTEIKT